ncbi:hypothetical protein BC628DRAFT_1347972 [Trametes gibbosa]|nr:hypothetical protein BC628DRAFT_1347972 [Trametes gibbosa]
MPRLMPSPRSGMGGAILAHGGRNPPGVSTCISQLAPSHLSADCGTNIRSLCLISANSLHPGRPR